jgi:hypothetical protein
MAPLTRTPAALDLLHDIIGNGHRASRYARMNGPGHPDKYTTVHRKLTESQLDRHIEGLETIAPILIGADGLASAGLAEQDTGSLDLARRIVEAGQVCGVTIAAIVCKGSDGHDGCHPWALYNGRYDPAAIRRQMQQVAALASASTDELYPSGKAIRAPGGKHLHTNDFGTGLLPSGELFDLNDPDERAAFFAAWYALPRNQRPPEPPKVERDNQTHGATISGSGNIAAFNNAGSLKADLEADGVTFDAGLTAPCNCGGHSRKGNRPTQLLKADNPAQSGEWIVVSHSADCKRFPYKGSRKFMDRYGNARAKGPVIFASSIAKAIKRAEPEPHYTQEQRAAYNAQRNAPRRAEAAAIRAAIREQAAHDDRLKPCDRATIKAMLAWADEHNAACCWLGRAALAVRAGYSLGAVKRSVMDLEEFGYFESTGKGGRPFDTAKRTFTCGSCFATENTFVPKDDPRIDISSTDLDQSSVACERPPAPTPERACEPLDLDTWQWVDDGHGADELNLLESQVYPRAAEPDDEPSWKAEYRAFASSPRGREWLEWLAQHPDPEGGGVAPERTVDLNAWHAVEHREACNARALDDVALDGTVSLLELAAAESRTVNAHRQADYWYAVCRIYRAEIDRREQADAVQQAKVNRILEMTDEELAALIAEPCNAQLDVTDNSASVPDAAGLIARLYARKENEHGQVDRPRADYGSVGGSGVGRDTAIQPPPAVEPEPDAAGGASYDPGNDWTRKRGTRPPKEADAVRKARRQARLRAMDAPELTREYWILTNKAKKCDGRQRETLLDLAKEVQHYRDLAYARRDEAVEDAPHSQAKPTLKPPPAFGPLFGGPGYD